MKDSYYELIVQHVSKLTQENLHVSLKWNCVKFEVYKVEVDSAIYNMLHMRGFCTLQATTSLMFVHHKHKETVEVCCMPLVPVQCPS